MLDDLTVLSLVPIWQEQSLLHWGRDCQGWKGLSKALWRNSLCLQIFIQKYPSILQGIWRKRMIHWTTLDDLLTDQIYSITLSESPVNTYGNHFRLCAKASTTDPVTHSSRQSQSVNSASTEIGFFRVRIASDALPRLRRLKWHSNFFRPLKNLLRFSWKPWVCWFVPSFEAEVSSPCYASICCLANVS